jgi:hypothetical protein
MHVIQRIFLQNDHILPSMDYSPNVCFSTDFSSKWPHPAINGWSRLTREKSSLPSVLLRQWLSDDPFRVHYPPDTLPSNVHCHGFPATPFVCTIPQTLPNSVHCQHSVTSSRERLLTPI